MALSEHWLKGGDGALELADAVMDACNEPNNFAPLYDWSMPFEQRIETIAKEVYGADGVEFSSLAKQRIKELQARPDAEELGICMVKTQYSLSDNPALKGAPTAGACMCATVCSTAVRAWWCRWPATSASCPVRVRVLPSAMWTWIWNPAR